MQKIPIPLEPDFIHCIETQIQSGRYSTTSEVVESGLRLLERELKVETLKEALDAGLRSGEPQLFDSDVFLSRMHAQVG